MTVRYDRDETEFKRRPFDGLLNVWVITDEGWTVVEVCETHREALDIVRELRAKRREHRERTSELGCMVHAAR